MDHERIKLCEMDPQISVWWACCDKRYRGEIMDFYLEYGVLEANVDKDGICVCVENLLSTSYAE